MRTTGGRFEAALLDFDMTLVDMSDKVDWQDAGGKVREMLDAKGFDVSNLHHLPVSLLREAAARDSLDPETRKERWMAASAVLCKFECRGAEHTSLKEGGMELLSYLNDSEISVAITSSNCCRAIDYCIEKLSLEELIDMTVTRDDVLWEMKPNSRPIRVALEKLGARADRSFGLGDSVVDIHAFSGAGVTPFGVTGGMSSRRELEDAGAAEVFSDLKELIDELSHSTR